ncbi:sigma-70 family RNA polymerase sigma factor [bacterium]|nr:sigma-70 family RNA polymerase sigma factor [bacterium]
MFLNLLNIIKDMIFFTGSYSNNVFPEPLSNEEEDKCIQEMLKGNKDARNKLIEHNLRLVAHIVKKFETKENDNDDLISIGTIGLIKGIDTYKNNKKTKITTYAARCIQNEILMHFRNNKKYGPTISLNDAIGHDKEGNEINLIDVIKDKNIDLFQEIELKNNISLLKKYLNLLNKREMEIIIKRYGLNNKNAMTQKEIADSLHISRSYVSRIEKRALTKMLTEFIKNKNID